MKRSGGSYTADGQTKRSRMANQSTMVHRQVATVETSSMDPSVVASTTISQNIGPNRSVFLGNVHPETNYEEILNIIKTGLVEQVKIVPEKSCAFITFVDIHAAIKLHQEATQKRFNVHGHTLYPGWGKAPPTPSSEVIRGLTKGATRSIWLGSVEEDVTEETLKTDLSEYGIIESGKILRDKRCAFVHFTSIFSAIRAHDAILKDPKYGPGKVNYGKDRCAGIVGKNVKGYNPITVTLMSIQNGMPMDPSLMPPADGNNQPYRTVYFGGLPPKCTYEDICNSVRGGLIEYMKILPEKNCAFIAFVDPTAAMQVYQEAATKILTIRGQDVKAGWGQPSHILSDVAMAIQNGATRNIWIGSVDEHLTTDKLTLDFSPYGTIESISVMAERKIAFVNFTSIGAAIKAMTALNQDPMYNTVYRLNYGRDRCANLSRIAMMTMQSYGIMPQSMQPMPGISAPYDYSQQATPQNMMMSPFDPYPTYPSQS